ncbi:MAG: response regulator transcription factor, partial [Nitrospirota bacterium]|nr:response regulator transcription factor [Nitrospirota bacterium]
VLADDHKIVRDGLRIMLEEQSDFEVVAEAEDGRTAVSLARDLKPDLIIMDVSMPDLNGIEATRQIADADTGTKVLALSMHSDSRYVWKMLRAGASGYMLKDCAFEELVHAVRIIAKNQVYLSPRITTVVVEECMYALDDEAANQLSSGTLTGREREVLQLLAEGRSSKDIAALLQVSIKTVETYRQNLMSKLNLHSVAELTKYAIREGITPLES